MADTRLEMILDIIKREKAATDAAKKSDKKIK